MCVCVCALVSMGERPNGALLVVAKFACKTGRLSGDDSGRGCKKCKGSSRRNARNKTRLSRIV